MNILFHLYKIWVSTRRKFGFRVDLKEAYFLDLRDYLRTICCRQKKSFHEAVEYCMCVCVCVYIYES